jgi:transposase
MSTERVMTNDSKKTTPASATLAGSQPVLRWSVSRKRDVVLRLLRGEPLDTLSRELGVEIYKLEAWRDRALSGMELGLKEREADDPLQQELDEAHKRIGELSMDNELLRKKAGKQGPFPSRKSRR